MYINVEKERFPALFPVYLDHRPVNPPNANNLPRNPNPPNAMLIPARRFKIQNAKANYIQKKGYRHNPPRSVSGKDKVFSQIQVFGLKIQKCVDKINCTQLAK